MEAQNTVFVTESRPIDVVVPKKQSEITSSTVDVSAIDEMCHILARVVMRVSEQEEKCQHQAGKGVQDDS